jgi:glycosyltransferase involved in cell wall biosynthesis
MKREELRELPNDAPRILELGNYPWVSVVMPRNTQFVYCGPKFNGQFTNMTLKLALELRRRLRRGDYDLMVWHIYYPKGSFWAEGRSGLMNAWIFARTALRQFQSIGRELIPWLMGGTKVPLVVIDRKDEPPMIISGELPLLKLCKAYFHRECPIQPYAAFYNTTRRFGDSANIKRAQWLLEHFAKIYPISLGCQASEGFVPSDRKRTDVFFAGAVDHSEARIKGMRVLGRLKGEGYVIDIPGYLHDRGEYLRRASEAYLVLSPQGLGWDCYRHYEAGYVGAVPVMNYPTIRRYQGLRHGVHAFYYGMEEEEELYGLLKGLLRDKERLVGMGKAAREHVLRYHTWDELVRYVLRIGLEG